MGKLIAFPTTPRKEARTMLRAEGPRPHLEAMTVRVPKALADRLNIYVASTRQHKQDIVTEVLTKYLDEVDPLGKAKQAALDRAAQADSAPMHTDNARIAALESQVSRLVELLTPQTTGTAPKRRRG